MTEDNHQSNFNIASSLKKKREIRFRISNLLIILTVIIAFFFGFVVGNLYKSNSSIIDKIKNDFSAQTPRRFVLGVIVVIQSNKVVISQRTSGRLVSFTINNNSLISVDGKKSTISQLKAGELALIRTTTPGSQTVKVLLVSTYETSNEYL